MRRSFDNAARRTIQLALNARPVESRKAVACPVCGGPLTTSPIAIPGALPYVRARVMVVCPVCELGTAVDVRAGAPP